MSLPTPDVNLPEAPTIFKDSNPHKQRGLKTVKEESYILPLCCCCTEPACRQVMEDVDEPLDSGWGSENEGCCCPTQRRSPSLKSLSWNVSPACHVCALAVLTGCQSTHVQTSERRRWSVEAHSRVVQRHSCSPTHSKAKYSLKKNKKTINPKIIPIL